MVEIETNLSFIDTMQNGACSDTLKEITNKGISAVKITLPYLSFQRVCALVC